MSNRDSKQLIADMKRFNKDPTEGNLGRIEGSANPVVRESSDQLEQTLSQFGQQSDRVQGAIDAISEGSRTEENSDEAREMLARARAELAFASASTPKPKATGRPAPPSQPPTPPREPQGTPPAQIDIAAFKALLDASEQQEVDAAKAQEEQVWAELNAQAEAELEAEHGESQSADMSFNEAELEESQLTDMSFNEAELESELDELRAQDPPQATVQAQKRVTPSATPEAATRPAAAPQSPRELHSTTPEAVPASASISAPAPASKGFWGNLFQKIKEGFQKLTAIFGNTDKQTSGPAVSTQRKEASQAKAGKTSDSTQRIFHAQGIVDSQKQQIQQLREGLEGFRQRQSARSAAHKERLHDIRAQLDGATAPRSSSPSSLESLPATRTESKGDDDTSSFKP